MYRYNKTSIILKISIAVLFIIGMVLECSCERSEEPEKRGTGYITCTLRWDSVVAGSPVPEKLRYCIYPSEGGPMIQTDGNANGITLFLPPDKYNTQKPLLSYHPTVPVLYCPSYSLPLCQKHFHP